MRQRRRSPSEKDIAEERDGEFDASSSVMTKERHNEEAPDAARGTGLVLGDSDGGEEAAAFLDGQEIGGDCDGGVASDNNAREVRVGCVSSSPY